MSRGTLRILALALFCLLYFVVFVRFRKSFGEVKFANRTALVSVLVCDTTPDVSGAKEIGRLACGNPNCAAEDLAQIFEREYLRHSGKKARFKFDVKLASSCEDNVVTPKPVVLAGPRIIWRLYRAFSANNLIFFDADARLVLKLVKKSSLDRAETSIGSSNLRLGYVEWRVGGTQQDYMWNITKTAHELGHVFGATDKYNAEGKTIIPDGLVDPSLGNQQQLVEIMSGTRPNGNGKEAEAKQQSELSFGLISAKEMNFL